MLSCEHLEAYLDEDGRVEEAFCRLGYWHSCSRCLDYTPPVEDEVFTGVEDAAQYEPPF